MVVYIEYALLENFVYDYVLLRLAFFATQERAKRGSIVFSALLGAVFALIFPFILLPTLLLLALKIGVGLLLCILPFGRLKTKKAWGRYGFTVLCFFFLTFAYGGTMHAFSGKISTPPAVFVCFFLLSLAAMMLIKKLYKKRVLHTFIYPCTLMVEEKCVRVLGYYDTGNCAQKNGVPICFVSPEIIYVLFGEKILKDVGTVRNETEITTLSGRKKAALFQGEIRVKTPHGETCKNKVYFSPSSNMITREYKVLLHATVLGE